MHELVERGIDPLSFRWLCFQTQYRSEMDFTWEAMEAADARVKQLRRHMAEWAPGADVLGTRPRRWPTTRGSARPWRTTSHLPGRSWS